ncbi:MAG: rhodanese-like domain-containing protein [Deltaproteobacteria bacterium]
MVKQISRDELKDTMSRDEEFMLVDVLSKESYSNEHIKGAISIPLEELERKAPKLLKKSEKIVVYCASFTCQASTIAAEKLEAMGYKNVLDYKGGLRDYKEADLPLEGKMHEKHAGVATSCC